MCLIQSWMQDKANDYLLVSFLLSSHALPFTYPNFTHLSRPRSFLPFWWSLLDFPLAFQSSLDLFFFFFNGNTCNIWKFSGQGWNQSISCNLCQSCSNARYFNLLCWARDWICVSAATRADENGFCNPPHHSRHFPRSLFYIYFFFSFPF